MDDKFVHADNSVSTKTSALQNGLNFVTTPKPVPTSRIVANVESGTYNLSGSAKAAIRAYEHLEEQQT